MNIRPNDFHLIDNDGTDLGHFADFVRDSANSLRFAVAKAAIDVFMIEREEQITIRQRDLNVKNIEVVSHKTTLDLLLQKSPIELKEAVAEAIASEVSAAVEIAATLEATKVKG